MDDDLARRPARLRQSLDSGNTVRVIDQGGGVPPDSDEDVLVTRFRNLFEKSPASKSKLHSGEITGNIYYESGQHISAKELISTLSSEKETWAVDKIDENQLEQLLTDIRASTSIQEVECRGASAESVPNWLQNNLFEEHIKRDADAEENILKMIKDEIEFEKAHGITMDEEEDGRWRESNQRGCPTPKMIEPDEDLIKRFEALGGLELPSVPVTDPPQKQVYSSNLVDKTDTWCCICNEDAEYRCFGCENDIYCASCLYEAHTGPDAGNEEGEHKWAKYIKPKKLALC